MGVKWHEVDQLLLPSAKVRMSAAVPLPLYIFMVKTWVILLLIFFPFGNLCQVDFSKILRPFTAQTVSM